MTAHATTRHAADDARERNPRPSAALRRDDASDDARARRIAPVAAALFGAIAVLMSADLILDAAEGARGLHLGTEAVVCALASAGLGWVWTQILRGRRANLRLRKTAAELSRDLERVAADARRWQDESRALVRGLGEAIDRQFTAWTLSAAEREVGLLLLKGLSLKEIAEARHVSERTVRQQALGIYRKAGVAGRAELSAFFLEDLLLPAGDRPA